MFKMDIHPKHLIQHSDKQWNERMKEAGTVGWIDAKRFISPVTKELKLGHRGATHMDCLGLVLAFRILEPTKERHAQYRHAPAEWGRIQCGMYGMKYPSSRAG
jgi:hypothetical protein